MEQTALPGLTPIAHGLARHSDPLPSQVAAKAVDVGRLEGLVLDALIAHGPGTSRDIAGWLRLDLVTVSPRMKPLENKNKVRRLEKPVGAKGRPITVWAAV